MILALGARGGTPGRALQDSGLSLKLPAKLNLGTRIGLHSTDGEMKGLHFSSKLDQPPTVCAEMAAFGG